MEQKEILEGNKLIAEFMGYSLRNVDSDMEWDFNPFANEGSPLKLPIIGGTINSMLFHSDWNWLMAVVEKILDTCSETDDMESYYTVVDAIPNITSTHRTVVEFINYYNSNK